MRIIAGEGSYLTPLAIYAGQHDERTGLGGWLLGWLVVGVVGVMDMLE